MFGIVGSGGCVPAIGPHHCSGIFPFIKSDTPVRWPMSRSCGPYVFKSNRSSLPAALSACISSSMIAASFSFSFGSVVVASFVCACRVRVGLDEPLIDFLDRITAKRICVRGAEPLLKPAY